MFCPISDLQEQIYQSILETEDVQLILHSSEPCDCYSGKKRGECCYSVSTCNTLIDVILPGAPPKLLNLVAISKDTAVKHCHIDS